MAYHDRWFIWVTAWREKNIVRENKTKEMDVFFHQPNPQKPASSMHESAEPGTKPSITTNSIDRRQLSSPYRAALSCYASPQTPSKILSEH
jgi:hypothetical protein